MCIVRLNRLNLLLIKYKVYIIKRLDENINEMIHTFEKASNNIANSLKLSSVLVCCSSGLNYGPSIIIGYLIKFKHW